MGKKGKPTPKAPQNREQVTVPLMRTVVHHQFNWSVGEGPEGSDVRQLTIQELNGEQHIYPLSADIAEEMGKALAAPSVQVAQPGDLRGLQPVGDSA